MIDNGEARVGMEKKLLEIGIDRSTEEEEKRKRSRNSLDRSRVGRSVFLIVRMFFQLEFVVTVSNS